MATTAPPQAGATGTVKKATYTPPVRTTLAERRKMTTRDLIKDPIGLPLDYSFFELKEMSDVIDEDPVSGTRKPRPQPEEPSDNPEQAAAKAKAAAEEKASRPACRAIRLSNNALTHLKGFKAAVEAVMDDSEKLSFVDLSYNKLSAIDEELVASFPNITTLYLHANGIASMKEVAKLSQLQGLHTLTLHGNPIENKKHYRQYVIACCPNLRTLDFIPLTRHDRTKATHWATVHKNSKLAHALRASASDGEGAA
eukprot:tig00020710_g13314.t1